MKVLFVNVSSIGHVVPTFNLVRGLVERGVQVVYLEVEHHRAELESFGARFLPLRPPVMEGRPQGQQIALLPAILAHTAVSGIAPVLESIEAERPDVVVHDSLCLWGRLAADLAAVPRVASIASAAISPAMLSGSPIVAAWLRAAGSTEAADAHFDRSWQSISDRYGCLVEDRISSVLNRAPVNIVHLSRSLQPNHDHFDSDFLFCGSGQPARQVRTSFDWSLVRGRRLVYMSFGTAHDPGRCFYAAVAEALMPIAATLVVVASPSMDGPVGIDWPPGTVVCANGTVPQVELLECADLFISHVGGGAVREAAWTATPILGLPQTFEQDLFCHHLAESGVAIRLSDQPDAREIRSAVIHMLADDGYRSRAGALSLAEHTMASDRLAADAVIAQGVACA